MSDAQAIPQKLRMAVRTSATVAAALTKQLEEKAGK